MNAIKSFIALGLCFLLSLEIVSAQERVESIATPTGFERPVVAGFGVYLRSLPLKPKGTAVRLYDGSEKSWQGGAYRVVDMEIGKSDLQQCADAVIRLRAEYLWKEKKYADIHFNFTNGFRANYNKWAEGYRIRVSGNKAEWYKASEPDYSYRSFRKYLNIVFSYAGTASLERELVSVDSKDIQVGDIFIQGGHPGHAMIVVDLCVGKNGKMALMAAQSYMPAQDIHIVANLDSPAVSPWYIFDASTKHFNFPEWSFTAGQLKRF